MYADVKTSAQKYQHETVISHTNTLKFFFINNVVVNFGDNLLNR